MGNTDQGPPCSQWLPAEMAQQKQKLVEGQPTSVFREPQSCPKVSSQERTGAVPCPVVRKPVEPEASVKLPMICWRPWDEVGSLLLLLLLSARPLLHPCTQGLAQETSSLCPEAGVQVPGMGGQGDSGFLSALP